MNSKHVFKLSSEFGRFCADGGRAIDFLKNCVRPACDNNSSEIVFDLDGVRNMNSSFANALFANLVRVYGEGVLSRISIVNSRENVKKEVASSLNFGVLSLRKAVAA